MRNGFTLTELLVSVFLIGALPAVIVPKLEQSQERARRAAVKNSMHVVQTALEAWAVDYGSYPRSDAAPFCDMADPNPADGSISAYFPGGDPFGNSGWGVPGRFPINPYTGLAYSEDNGDLVYGDDYTEGDVPGDVWNGDPSSPNFDCLYDGLEAPNDLPGTIGVCTCADGYTDKVTDYGIAGYGADITRPMYDYLMVSDLMVSDSLRMVYYILHN